PWSGPHPAYLQEAVADYRHVGALDQAVVSQGTGTYPTAGPTASVPAGELVVAAVLTGGQPGSAAAGSSQRVPYLIDAQNGSASSDLEDILSSAAGPQEGSLTLGSASNWVMVLATFQSTPGSATTSTTTPVQTTTTTTTPLIACGGLYPLCLGSCPPGLTCTGGGLLGACACQ